MSSESSYSLLMSPSSVCFICPIAVRKNVARVPLGRGLNYRNGIIYTVHSRGSLTWFSIPLIISPLVRCLLTSSMFSLQSSQVNSRTCFLKTGSHALISAQILKHRQQILQGVGNASHKHQVLVNGMDVSKPT